MTTYTGDVKLIPTEDGGDILFVDGQPVMDQGLETATYISLFTARGWWGNAVVDADEQIGANLEELFKNTITNKTRQDSEQAVRDALQWMIDQGVAKSIEVESRIPSVGRLELSITITEPGKDSLSSRYMLNWNGQRASLEVA